MFCEIWLEIKELHVKERLQGYYNATLIEYNIATTVKLC